MLHKNKLFIVSLLLLQSYCGNINAGLHDSEENTLTPPARPAPLPPPLQAEKDQLLEDTCKGLEYLDTQYDSSQKIYHEKRTSIISALNEGGDPNNHGDPDRYLFCKRIGEDGRLLNQAHRVFALSVIFDDTELAQLFLEKKIILCLGQDGATCNHNLEHRELSGTCNFLTLWENCKSTKMADVFLQNNIPLSAPALQTNALMSLILASYQGPTHEELEEFANKRQPLIHYIAQKDPSLINQAYPTNNAPNYRGALSAAVYILEKRNSWKYQLLSEQEKNDSLYEQTRYKIKYNLLRTLVDLGANVQLPVASQINHVILNALDDLRNVMEESEMANALKFSSIKLSSQE